MKNLKLTKKLSQLDQASPKFKDYKKRIKVLKSKNFFKNLRINAGIEKESLRVNKDNGFISQKDHPKSLGSPLTNSSITTDFSEALIELVTPVFNSSDKLYKYLYELHVFINSNLDNEVLWSFSMPPKINKESDIRIAEYGNSNIGKIKELYRKGLELRYGPSMQCVAGIHYNFSLHPSSLKTLLSSFGVQHSNDLYLSLIRNFKRYYWFILIHFGRSSIIDKSFIRGREHKLVKLNDCDLFMKYATSLRMSDIGYKSSAQKNLKIKYNSLNEFLDKVRDAVIQPHEGFAKLGHRDENGDFKQISTGIIQIENELYDEIRPKRSLKDNKRPYHLLKKEGIEYIEVRGIDLNPDESIGISLNQILFLNVFLLWCAINESPLISDSEYRRIENNNNSVIQNGNDFSSLLEVKGGKKEINESMSDIFHELEILANELDDRKYILAIKEIKNNNYNFNMNDTFHNFALKKSIEHSNRFNSYKLNKEIFDKFNKQALNSINEFNKINNKTESSFENYVNSYNKKLKEGDI